jgi:hypothetical protein
MRATRLACPAAGAWLIRGDLREVQARMPRAALAT